MSNLNWLSELNCLFKSSCSLSGMYDINEMSIVQKYSLYRILKRGGVV